MNIQQIKDVVKSVTGLTDLTLDMGRETQNAVGDDGKELKDEKGGVIKLPLPWYSYWHEEPRFRVVTHEDIFKALKENRNIEGLALKSYNGKKYEEVTPVGKAPYKRFVITMPSTIEASF